MEARVRLIILLVTYLPLGALLVELLALCTPKFCFRICPVADVILLLLTVLQCILAAIVLLVIKIYSDINYLLLHLIF